MFKSKSLEKNKKEVLILLQSAHLHNTNGNKLDSPSYRYLGTIICKSVSEELRDIVLWFESFWKQHFHQQFYVTEYCFIMEISVAASKSPPRAHKSLHKRELVPPSSFAELVCFLHHMHFVFGSLSFIIINLATSSSVNDTFSCLHLWPQLLSSIHPLPFCLNTLLEMTSAEVEVKGTDWR